MRLIDADALIASLEKWSDNGDSISMFSRGLLLGMSITDEQPTIDAVEVKHGHWIVLQNRAVESICYWSEEQKKADKKGAGTEAKCKCSNCNWRTNFMGYVKTGIENMFNYCPNCGAKMDEVTE